MVIRLLQKSEVQKAKALERQKEIEEGKKLATRVDKLRELSADEERNLRESRDKAISAIRIAINPLIEQKEDVERQITTRREELATLMRPIDDRWVEINQAQKLLDDWEEDLEKRDGENELVKSKNLDIATKLSKREKNLEHNEAVFKEMLAEAVHMSEQAKEILADARNEAQAHISASELIKTQLREREEKIAARERDAVLKEKLNAETQKYHAEEKIKLTDMRATLERGLQRLKNKK